MQYLRELNERNRAGVKGQQLGASTSTPSVCSAHPEVLLASMLLVQELERPLLIEATSNQVNQFGGYTGMQAEDFIRYVHNLCTEHGIVKDAILFGGDHLGPQAWRDQDANLAMDKAKDLVTSYVKAGFTKIHLDCSEGCAGEDAQVGDAISAHRAAELALACEQAANDPDMISYVIGTEVPPPGGARADDGGMLVIPTSADSARQTLQAHRQQFAKLGLQGAWSRVAGLVVQPGLEFSPDSVHHFDLRSEDTLSSVLAEHPHMAFEAHSTDYQKDEVFADLAWRHFSVLKVGPALTFAYRQAIYALDNLSTVMLPNNGRASISSVMEKLMVEKPHNWQKHYSGDAQAMRLLRHYGYADRVRYYWGQQEAQVAVLKLNTLMQDLSKPIEPVICQFFATDVIERASLLESKGYNWSRSLILAQVQMALSPYF